MGIFVFPRAGLFVALFAGVPLALAQVAYHRYQLGVGAMVLAGLVVEILSHSPLGLLLYMAWAGLSGVLAGELVRRHKSFNFSLATISGQIIGFSSFILAFFYFKTQGRIFEEVQKQLYLAFDQVFRLYLKNSPTSLPVADRKILLGMEPDLFKSFITVLPGIGVATVLLTALVLVSTVEGLLSRKASLPMSRGIDKWHLWDPSIFVLIGGLALIAIPNHLSRVLGINAFMAVGTLYVGQGAGVIVSYAKGRGFGILFWILSATFILLQPLILVMLGVVGVLDVWLDFRKIRRTTDNNPATEG
jgi:uncharacterized protein YybS (DUF2232 family)